MMLLGLIAQSGMYGVMTLQKQIGCVTEWLTSEQQLVSTFNLR